MNAESLLRAFDAMPVEERRALRARILLGENETGGCTESLRHRLRAMMKEIETCEHPPGAYREMARMCLERMSFAGELDFLEPPREWTRTWALPDAV